MNVDDCLRRVRTSLGDSGGTMVTLTEGIDFVNDALLEINLEAKVIRGTHNFNTVDGTISYAVPAAFASCIELSLANFGLAKPIQRNAIRRYDRGLGLSNNKGQPYFYSIDGTSIKFYPTPDSIIAVTMEYVAVPTLLTVGSDALPLPTYLHPLVPRFVTALYKERDEDFDAAASIKAEVLREAAIRVAKAQDAQEEEYFVVPEYDPEVYVL